MSGDVDRLLLSLEERISTSISLGESHFREFKSAFEGIEGKKRTRSVKNICRDIGETLCSFVNADGGELLIGVEDDGRITGIKHSDERILTILNAYKTHIHFDTPLPMPISTQLNIMGERIIYFSVDKGREYVYLTSSGRCLQRYDRDNIPRSVEKIKYDRQEQLSKEYDRAYVDGATPSDLNQTLLNLLVDKISPNISYEKCLQYVNLADFNRGQLRIRKAGVLLFSDNFSRWYPKNEVRIIKVNGIELKSGAEYNVDSDEIVRGNIITLLEQSWNVIRPYLVETRLSKDGVFIERILYPEIAVREALINAIAHRDYSMEGSGIEIHIYDDRMEISSPGSLLSTINVEDLRRLKGVHESRNVLISRVLRELLYMRELGEGMRRIYSVIEQHDLIPPEIISSEDKFVIKLSHISIFSPSDQLWLDSYENFDLSREERLVMILGRSGRLLAPQEIIDRCNIIDTADYTALIYSLQVKGVLYSIMRSSEATGAAKRQKKSRRRVPRYKIQDVRTCKRDFSELIRALILIGSHSYYSRNEILDIKKKLTINNIYNREWTWVSNSLKAFNLITPQNEPTEKLRSLTGLGINLTTERYKSDTEKFVLSEKDLIAESKDLVIPFSGEIFLAGLPHSATSEEIHLLVSDFGQYDRIEIPKLYESNENRGFAFIFVSDRTEAKKIKESLSGVFFKGKLLHTDWAHGRVKGKR